MLFSVSGVEVNPIIPFIVAFIVSFFTSMGGISGAFLLLPFQVSVLGYSTPSVSATNQVFNIVAIPSGVYRYIRECRMLWPLTNAVIIGTMPGVFIGAWVRIKYLPDPKNFRLFAGIVLGYIGFRLLLDIIKKSGRKRTLPGTAETQNGQSVKLIKSSIRKVVFDYGDNTYEFSPMLVYFICLLVGIIGGIYGIGGGSIIAPFFITFVGLPVYTIAGATLMGTFITSVAGVIFYQSLAGVYTSLTVAPDWALGALFGLGGVFGMYLGARTQRFVSEKIIKTILCGCVLFLSFNYIIGFF